MGLSFWRSTQPLIQVLIKIKKAYNFRLTATKCFYTRSLRQTSSALLFPHPLLPCLRRPCLPLLPPRPLPLPLPPRPLPLPLPLFLRCLHMLQDLGQYLLNHVLVWQPLVKKSPSKVQ